MEDEGRARPRLGMEGMSIMMLSEEEKSRVSKVSSKWVWMTRQARMKERGIGVRRVHLKEFLDFGQQVLVFVSSKTLNITYR